eukprot:UN05017
MTWIVTALINILLFGFLLLTVSGFGILFFFPFFRFRRVFLRPYYSAHLVLLFFIFVLIYSMKNSFICIFSSHVS